MVSRPTAISVLTLFIALTIALIGGIVWHHLDSTSSTTPSQATSSASSIPISEFTASTTEAALETIQYLTEQNPSLLDLSPVSRLLSPASPEHSSAFSFVGLTFSAPWVGISSTVKTSSSLVLAFVNGSSLTLVEPPPADKARIEQVATLSSTITDEFDLEDAAFSATPAQVTTSTPPSTALLAALLLTLKAELLIPTNALFQFETGAIEGFQFGNPVPNRPTIITFFDRAGNKYAMTLTGSQDDIDFVLASING